MSIIHRIHRSIDTKALTVFLIHGKAGTLDVMNIFLNAIPKRMNVISLQAPFEDPIGGFSWWLGDDKGRYVDSIDQLEELIMGIVKQQGVSKDNLIGIGFSQGGAMLSVVLQRKKVAFKGIGMLASFVIPIESQGDHDEDTSPQPAVYMSIGTIDTTVPLERSIKGVRFLAEKGYTVKCVFEKVGHKTGRAGMKELKAWLDVNY
jgi:predicted esterase